MFKTWNLWKMLKIIVNITLIKSSKAEVVKVMLKFFLGWGPLHLDVTVLGVLIH